MTNVWKATHVEDHGVIDSEFGSTAACLSVLFGFHPYRKYSASLNHPLCM